MPDILLLILAILVAALTLFALGIGYYFYRQVVLIPVTAVDETYRIEVKSGKLVEAEYNAWERREVHLQSRYGYTLYGLYFPMPGAQHTIIITHGVTFSLFGSVKYIPLFRKRGYNVLIYDHRRHGRSGGKTSTYGFYEKYDLQAWIAWAFKELGLQGRVGVMGESYGAATALQYLELETTPSCIDFVISDCAFSDLTELLAYHLRQDYRFPIFPSLPLASLWARLLAGFNFSQVSPLRAVQQNATPVLFIHAGKDPFTPPRMTRALYTAKNLGYKRLYLPPKGGHAEAFWCNQEEYDRVVGDFLAALEWPNASAALEPEVEADLAKSGPPA